MTRRASIIHWLREVREPLNVEDRIPDGPDTVYWWVRFWLLILRGDRHGASARQ